jgi:hypothetical protein
LEDRDPLSIVATGIINQVTHSLANDVARDYMRSKVYDSMIEGQFLKLFNRDFMPKMVREVVEDSLTDSHLEE